ncbi:MAG: thiol-disulfide oxidoreductase DCC family protein [Oligoflexus sp.]
MKTNHQTNNKGDLSYTVFYDADCPICRRSRRILQKMGQYPCLNFIDVNDRRELARWPMINAQEAQKKVTLVTPDNRRLTAFDAVAELIASRSRFFRLLLPLLRTQVVRVLGQFVYNLVSHNRYGISHLLGLENETDKAQAGRQKKRLTYA